MRTPHPDATWERGRQDFCSGEMTLADAAAKHQIAFNTVETRARREGWRRRLNENVKVVKEIAGAALQRSSAELGARAAEFMGESTEQLKALLADFKDKRGPTATLADFERYVETFATLIKTGRELYGLDQRADSNPRATLVLSVVQDRGSLGSLRSSGTPAIDVESTSDPTPTVDATR